MSGFFVFKPHLLSFEWNQVLFDKLNLINHDNSLCPTMNLKLQILPTGLLNDYLRKFDSELKKAFDELMEAELTTTNFSFYTSVASVFSSKIEGEPIELDSYIKHKREGLSFQPDYTKKIDDLYAAYEFAQGNPLKESTVKEAHRILSRHLVADAWQGRYRTQNMYVATEEGKIEYVAPIPSKVEGEMQKFFLDIKTLLETDLSFEEVFYFSALIHLVFVKIHPWNDGNGRSARLLEKWFLAEKLGEKAWFVQSEKTYYQNHDLYYHHIRALGLEYETLDYSKALPFLMLLPSAVNPKF